MMRIQEGKNRFHRNNLTTCTRCRFRAFLFVPFSILSFLFVSFSILSFLFGSFSILLFLLGSFSILLFLFVSFSILLFLFGSFSILSFWCSVHTKCFREKCSVQFTVWELATSTPIVKG